MLDPMIFALFSAVTYGVGDFLGGRASVRLPTLTVLAIAQIAACTIALIPMTVGPTLSDAPTASLLLGGVSGLCHVAAVGLLYHGLAHGRVCVMAPVCGVVNIAFPVAVDGLIINGLSLTQGGGILLAVAAVGLVSCAAYETGRPPRSPRLDLLWGAVSGFLFGVGDLSLGSVDEMAVGNAVLVARLMAAGFIILVLIVRHRAALCAMFRTGVRPELWAGARSTFAVAGVLLALAAGAGDYLGHLSYAMSATQGELSVAVAISAMFPAVSVLLAILFLKERIGSLQSLGLCISAGSVTLLAAA